MNVKLINFVNIFKFLSTYIFIFALIYLYFPNIEVFQKNRNILFLTTLSCIGCSYLLFINPKYFKLGNSIIPKWMSYVFYILFHILIFILVFCKLIKMKSKYDSSESLLPSLIIGIIYIIFFNPEEIYEITWKNIVFILFISIIFFCIFEFFINQL